MAKDIGISPGDEFGRLKVIEKVEDKVYPDGKHKSQYLCECGCEAHTRLKVTGVGLKSGNVKSCGCLKKETTRSVGLANTTFGISTSKIAQAYYNLKNRYPEDILATIICPSWFIPRQGIKNFYDDMNSTYVEGARLDRVDHSLAYSPENCYWKISDIIASRTGFTNAIRYD